ncbi:MULTISPECIES: O-antigen polymerase [unclassified Bacteroides]|uniref:O-antigen polymerase n=1 Tax=unclassified Bacteroides TaxID=2646097 RepID=UPI0013EE3089|nr:MULTISPECIES: O-antigen polymerase [unclassified Bacteroides]QTO24229.1 oligosaccharide repeat unit polymerase [Bacteroides sp. ZJ-18]
MKIVKSLNLSSPVLVFGLIWIILILLYNIHLINYYLGLNQKTLILIFGAIGAMALSWVLIRMRYKRWIVFSIKNLPDDKFSLLESKIGRLLKLWLIGIVATIVLQGGFPMLWMLLGTGKGYQDFGFHSIHGILNALYYICILGYFFLYLKKKESKYLKLVLLLSLYPILAVSRAVIIVVIFEMLGLYLLLYRIRLKQIIKIFIGGIAFILLFGALGDLRVGEAKHVLHGLVDKRYEDVMEYLPSGVCWVYLYFTGSIDNVVYNINDLKPLYYPYFSIKPLIPSVFRDLIFEKKDYDDKYSLEMNNTIFNTFSFFANYLKDFGIYITIVIIFFIGLLSNYIYAYARLMKFNFIMMYPIVFMFLLLSVFSDFFISLPTLCQMIISCKYLKI